MRVRWSYVVVNGHLSTMRHFRRPLRRRVVNAIRRLGAVIARMRRSTWRSA